jgi:membrane-bound metal-dependent hydrolase YbcI (DUF457 family)
VPFTPFHLGPALLFGLMLFAFLDLPTFLIANVLPDIEPFCVRFFDVSGYPLHGFFHSYLGASILALLLTAIVYPLRSSLTRIMEVFRVSQAYSFKKILFTSLVGVYFHVFLDSFLYSEMAPFYPFQGNPFFGTLSVYDSYSVVYGFCSIAFVLGIITYFFKIVRKAKA